MTTWQAPGAGFYPGQQGSDLFLSVFNNFLYFIFLLFVYYFIVIFKVHFSRLFNQQLLSYHRPKHIIYTLNILFHILEHYLCIYDDFIAMKKIKH